MPFKSPSPFRLFDQFPAFEVGMLIKQHNVLTDEDVAKALGVPEVASMEQTHEDGVAVAEAADSRVPGVDGLITAVPNLTLTVRWADCQNFAIYAPKQGVCGILHAGWKSLAANIIPTFFKKLEKEFSVKPADTYVGAGPSLCMMCADFTDPATELPAEWVFHIDGKYADLQGIATKQILNLGVPRSHFERHPDCPRCMPETYWTWRGRDKTMPSEKLRNVLACRIVAE